MPADQDPKDKHAKPTFPQREIDVPGHESELTPKADHGEQTYRGSGKLKGKATLITGGDSGIGKAVAIAFAREGADVAIVYLPEEEDDARDTDKYVKQAGGKSLLIPGDLTSEAFCVEAVVKTANAFGRLDVLVNNAAYQKTYETIEEIPAAEWERTMSVNITAMFHLCKAAVTHMKPGANIINVSSIQAYQPSPQLLAYATTKGAIVNFTKGLAQMLIGRGIRVNSVAPGPVWTPLIPSTMGAEAASEFGKESPMERPAQPAELAAAFVLLASDEASYISAAILPVTGGKPTM